MTRARRARCASSLHSAATTTCAGAEILPRRATQRVLVFEAAPRQRAEASAPQRSPREGSSVPPQLRFSLLLLLLLYPRPPQQLPQTLSPRGLLPKPLRCCCRCCCCSWWCCCCSAPAYSTRVPRRAESLHASALDLQRARCRSRSAPRRDSPWASRLQD